MKSSQNNMVIPLPYMFRQKQLTSNTRYTFFLFRTKLFKKETRDSENNSSKNVIFFNVFHHILTKNTHDFDDNTRLNISP